MAKQVFVTVGTTKFDKLILSLITPNVINVSYIF